MFTIDETTLDMAFDRLRTLAVRTITTHNSRSGQCAACEGASPCEQAVLAAHNLELVSGINRQPEKTVESNAED